MAVKAQPSPVREKQYLTDEKSLVRVTYVGTEFAFVEDAVTEDSFVIRLTEIEEFRFRADSWRVVVPLSSAEMEK